MINDLTAADLVTAASLGHKLVWDPPPWANHIGRWSCTQCPNKIITRSHLEAYGTALMEPCKGAQP